MWRILVVIAAALGVSCAGVDRDGVKPRSGAPEVTRVPQIAIPYDPGMARYALVVRPVSFFSSFSEIDLTKSDSAQAVSRTNVTTSHGASDTVIRWKQGTIQPDSYAIGAQLVSALNGVKNFDVYDIKAATDKGNGKMSLPDAPYANGPFIVEAVVTVYESRVEEEKTSVGLPLVAGRKTMLRTGVVGLDVSLVDGRSGKVVTAFPVEGTFAVAEAQGHAGLVFDVYSGKTFVQSVMEQARRVALNEAAQKIFSAMKAAG